MLSGEDMELLRAYVENDSEEAFETLLKRHLNLVYSTALRQVRDPVLAGEVTQTTFIILAQKASGLGKNTVLAGWLYRTAQYAAARALRTEARRIHRETEAALMQIGPTESVWDQLSPILDQAMSQLGTSDRDALILAYFDNKTAKDVGRALGINEAAAQKRVTRAVEKLRVLCTKKGVVLSTVGLTGLLTANAVQAAPASVAAATSAAFKAGALGAAHGSLTSGTLKLIAWAKIKIAAITGLTVATVTVGTFAFIHFSNSEPVYHGVTLSGWLEQLDNHDARFSAEMPWTSWSEQWQPSAKQAEAADAIRAMGNSAVPSLLAILEKTNTSHFLMSRSPKEKTLDSQHRQAALALDALGPVCKPWTPELARILKSEHSCKEAALALAAIGSEGWEILKQTATDKGDASVCAIWAIGSHRIDAPGMEDALMTGYSQNNPIGNDIVSLWALTQITTDHSKLIPLLTDGLHATRSDMRWGSAFVLGQLGPEARSALPDLWQSLRDSSQVVRHDAAQAIQQIDPLAASQGGLADALTNKHVPKTSLF